MANLPVCAVLILSLTINLQAQLAASQTTNATCNPESNTSFLFNSFSESPCLVWAKLQSLCMPESASINVPPLNGRSFGYNSPGASGDDCQCNVVAYNLMAGCSWCQLGNTSNWATEQSFRTDCLQYYADGLPFSESVVSIPPFAWKSWNGSRWEPDAASAAAMVYVATSLPPSSTTLSRAFPSGDTSTGAPTALVVPVASNPRPTSSSGVSLIYRPPSSTSTTAMNGDGSSSQGTPESSSAGKWGPIVGGIAGGMILLVVLVFLFFQWRNKRRDQHKPRRHDTAKPKVAGDVKPGGGSFKSFRSSTTIAAPWHKTSTDHKEVKPGGDIEKDGQGPYNAIKPIVRQTELINDPESFFSPRTAPFPAGILGFELGERKGSLDSIASKVNEKLRYTTTSERREKAASSNWSESSIGNDVYSRRPSMVSTIATPLISPRDARRSLARQSIRMDQEETRVPNGTPPLRPKSKPSLEAYVNRTSFPFPPPTIPLPEPPTAAAAATAPPRQSLRLHPKTQTFDPRASRALIIPALPESTFLDSGDAHDFTLSPSDYQKKISRDWGRPAAPPQRSQTGDSVPLRRAPTRSRTDTDTDTGKETNTSGAKALAPLRSMTESARSTRTEAGLLPSLYEPLSGAPRWTLSARDSAPSLPGVPFFADQGPVPHTNEVSNLASDRSASSGMFKRLSSRSSWMTQDPSKGKKVPVLTVPVAKVGGQRVSLIRASLARISSPASPRDGTRRKKKGRVKGQKKKKKKAARADTELGSDENGTRRE